MTDEMARFSNRIAGLRKVQSQQARVSSNSSPLPVFFAYQAVTQTVGSSTVITLDTVTLDTEDSRTPRTVDEVITTDKYVCRAAGLYLLSGGVAYVAQASNQRLAWFRKNGTQLPASAMRLPVPTSSFSATIATRVIPVQLAVGDYIELMGGVTAGTISTAASGSDHSSLFIQKIRNG